MAPITQKDEWNVDMENFTQQDIVALLKKDRTAMKSSVILLIDQYQIDGAILKQLTTSTSSYMPNVFSSFLLQLAVGELLGDMKRETTRPSTSSNSPQEKNLELNSQAAAKAIPRGLNKQATLSLINSGILVVQVTVSLIVTVKLMQIIPIII